jgi:hypothetical protein
MSQRVQRPLKFIKIKYGPHGVMGEKPVGTIVDFPDNLVVIDEKGKEIDSNAAPEQELITAAEHRRVPEWLDEQGGKLRGFMRAIKCGNRETFNDYTASLTDPFSRQEHKNVPKWAPHMEVINTTTDTD